MEEWKLPKIKTPQRVNKDQTTKKGAGEKTRETSKNVVGWKRNIQREERKGERKLNQLKMM